LDWAGPARPQAAPETVTPTAAMMLSNLQGEGRRLHVTEPHPVETNLSSVPFCRRMEYTSLRVWKDKREGGSLHKPLRCAQKKRRKRRNSYDSRGRLAGKRHISQRPAFCRDPQVDRPLGDRHRRRTGLQQGMHRDAGRAESRPSQVRTGSWCRELNGSDC
jgi:hypothetical protein